MVRADRARFAIVEKDSLVHDEPVSVGFLNGHRCEFWNSVVFEPVRSMAEIVAVVVLGPTFGVGLRSF